jgi:hypothetical protein
MELELDQIGPVSMGANRIAHMWPAILAIRKNANRRDAYMGSDPR